jgi:hypothetical protein
VKKIILLCGSVLILLATACKKDVPDFTGYKPIESDTTGDGTTEPVLSDNYQPVTAGSYLKYLATVGAETDTALITMNGTTETFNDRIFNFATLNYIKSNEADSNYFYNNGNDFIERDIIDGDTSEVLYMKLNAEVNDTWSADLYNPENKSRATATMVEKNITKTVLTKTFNNVIHTHIEWEASLDGSEFTSLASYDYYIAQGIGIIEMDITAFGIISGKTQLINYSIK